MGLKRYKQKRNFRATPEPAGKVRAAVASQRMFVIQKHDATRLHYDFRLELEGVLVSWAVPKGIPTAKADKRLAMHVEDHPLDYGDFEGVIPEGNYGAGSVMVWDTGTWEPMEGNPAKGLRAGKLKFQLHGQKLEGEWTLVRMRARSAASGKDEWLLIKTGDDTRPISTRRDDESVLTRRTMAQIADGKTRTWQSNREAASNGGSFKQRVAAKARRKAGARPKPAANLRRRDSRTALTTEAAARAASSAIATHAPDALKTCPPEEPGFVEPMKARLIESLPIHGNWLLELKHDGYRTIAVKQGNAVELFSRNHLKMTARFPGIVAAVRRLPVRRCVIDGEIVALDQRGHGSFQLLQNRDRITDESKIVFYVFDLLNLDGRDVRDLPLTARRELLVPLLVEAGDPVRFSGTLPGSVDVVLTEIKRMGLEGIIAKKPASKYEPGLRTGSWVKLKCINEQEFVIGGYTQPKGSRDHFGALIVGYYDADRLTYASKVGTGFTQSSLRDLFKRFKPLRQSACPFVNLPTRRRGRWGQGMTASEMKQCTWLEPQLVAQVRFSEWTSDGGLRHPVFLGLREDKDAREVTRSG